MPSHKRGGMRRERPGRPLSEEDKRMTDQMIKDVPCEFCNSCGALLHVSSGPCSKCGTEEPR